MMSERVRLWSNGFEFDCWAEQNCHRCVKAGDDAGCDLYDAISEAMMTDGTFAPEIVARFGWKPEHRAVLGWPCKELQAEGPVLPKPAYREMRDAGAAMLPWHGGAVSQRGGKLAIVPPARRGVPLI